MQTTWNQWGVTQPNQFAGVPHNTHGFIPNAVPTATPGNYQSNLNAVNSAHNSSHIPSNDYQTNYYTPPQATQWSSQAQPQEQPMQEQQWQQWEQWQQRYSQWHQQYGEKYQAQMTALGMPPAAATAAAIAAGVPAVAAAAMSGQLPPLPQGAPAAQPPPPVEKEPSTVAESQVSNRESTSKRTNDSHPEKDELKKLKVEKSGKGKNETLEDIIASEKAFDEQFQNWESEFLKWKEQNANHPDKSQYKEYEAKWESWREQLIQKREQMRKKRENKETELAKEKEVKQATSAPSTQSLQNSYTGVLAPSNNPVAGGVSTNLSQSFSSYNYPPPTNNTPGQLAHPSSSLGNKNQANDARVLEFLGNNRNNLLGAKNIPGLDLVGKDNSNVQGYPQPNQQAGFNQDFTKPLQTPDDKPFNFPAQQSNFPAQANSFPTPSNMFQSQTNNFAAQPNNFPTPSNNFPPPPSNFLPPSNNFPPPTSNFLPPTNNFPPPTNTFPPQTNTFPPPSGNFPPQANNFSGHSNVFPTPSNNFSTQSTVFPNFSTKPPSLLDINVQQFQPIKSNNNTDGNMDRQYYGQDSRKFGQTGGPLLPAQNKSDYGNSQYQKNMPPSLFSKTINFDQNKMKQDNDYQDDKYAKYMEDEYDDSRFRDPEPDDQNKINGSGNGPKNNNNYRGIGFHSNKFDNDRSNRFGKNENSDFRNPPPNERFNNQNVRQSYGGDDRGPNNREGDYRGFNNRGWKEGDGGKNFQPSIPPPSESLLRPKYLQDSLATNKSPNMQLYNDGPRFRTDTRTLDRMDNNHNRPPDFKTLEGPKDGIVPPWNRNLRDETHLNIPPGVSSTSCENDGKAGKIVDFKPEVIYEYNHKEKILYPSSEVFEISIRYDYSHVTRKETDQQFVKSESWNDNTKSWTPTPLPQREKRNNNDRRPNGQAQGDRGKFVDFTKNRENNTGFKKENEKDNNFSKGRNRTNSEPYIIKKRTIPDSQQHFTVLAEDLLSQSGRKNRPLKIVIIMRGPPGSGKTFLAKLIKDKEVEMGGTAPRILSIDDYFVTEVEKEVVDASTEKKTTTKTMEYVYDNEMENVYQESLSKAFKKTITDGFFPFIILDSINDKVKHYEDLYMFAIQKGFKVYICQLDLDMSACLKRNIHNREEKDIKTIIEAWDKTPLSQTLLDPRSLLQSAAITDVDMEDVSSEEVKVEESKTVDTESRDDEKNEVDEVENVDDKSVEETNEAISSQFDIFCESKWDKMENSEDKLDRLDGLRKRKTTSIKEWLESGDSSDLSWYTSSASSSNTADEAAVSVKPKKRVRWADLEERLAQEKMRAIGFVVGQTDWNRMMDPNSGDNKLNQTKYI